MKLATKHLWAIPLAVGLLATGTSACGSSTATSAPTPVGCSPGGQAASADSASYHYVLDVGPSEQMYSSSQVASQHPKNGEVMLQGAMTMGPGADAQHLEVHICSRSNGDVVTGTAPSITLADTTANTTTQVQVATMQGVTSGVADRHYGNNVQLPPGHAFAVDVGFRGQRATLHFTRPG